MDMMCILDQKSCLLHICCRQCMSHQKHEEFSNSVIPGLSLGFQNVTPAINQNRKVETFYFFTIQIPVTGLRSRLRWFHFYCLNWMLFIWQWNSLYSQAPISLSYKKCTSDDISLDSRACSLRTHQSSDLKLPPRGEAFCRHPMTQHCLHFKWTSGQVSLSIPPSCHPC